MTLSPCYLSEIDHDGFSLAVDVVDSVQTSLLVEALEQRPASPHDRMRAVAYGRRDLLRVPEIARLASSEPIRALVNPVLGENAFCVRGIWFDKLPEANWKVAWHQDLTIAVRERIDVPQFSAWSIKEGVVHVQPPVEVLQRMLTVRIHLDDCGEGDGPLRVMAGAHRCGRLSADAIEQWKRAHREVICRVPRGGALIMRPLLLHASSAARHPSHRRVIHLEFAVGELPGGLAWHTRLVL